MCSVVDGAGCGAGVAEVDRNLRRVVFEPAASLPYNLLVAQVVVGVDPYATSPMTPYGGEIRDCLRRQLSMTPNVGAWMAEPARSSHIRAKVRTVILRSSVPYPLQGSPI